MIHDFCSMMHLKSLLLPLHEMTEKGGGGGGGGGGREISDYHH